MSCKPLLIGQRSIEAHLINGKTLAMARDAVEACGSLVYWDARAAQARAVPALAPPWEELDPLRTANARWPSEYRMHQARLDYIWGQALRHQVDPYLMVAILIHEGTGSFNTNSSNSDQYNGNGPDANWIRDTARAVSHVAGKLARYHQAVAAGFVDAARTLGLQGTAIQFAGWPGPIWNHSPTWGCYAQHADWWRGVSSFYEQMGGDVELLTEFWRQRRIPVNSIQLRCEPVTDRPDLCSDLSGRYGRPGVVTHML